MPTKKIKPLEEVITAVAETSQEAKPLATAGAVVNYRDSWRIFKIMAEFVDGYQFLGQLEKEVVILGSARIPPNNKYYKIAEDFGKLLGKNGFTTITGGGPGIMEAANKGAYEVGGQSVGLNIQLPFEQRTNPYVKKSTAFYYFFTRKVMLTSPGNAFVFFPGGFGTLDEFFEVVDSMELGQMDPSPIVLVGREFWEPLIKFLKSRAIDRVSAVREELVRGWHIVDTAAEAFEIIKEVKDRPNICNKDPNNPLCVEGTDWKIFRIMSELVDGFEFLTKVQNDVTVLGTKSILPDSSYYREAYAMGKLLADRKVAVVTGGGPGIMEAASRGAFERGGETIGINMKFASGKERINNYLTKSIGFFFPFVRKLIITSPSKAFVFFPGGFGTLHQLFELLTLQETKKMDPIPILLYDREYWQPLMDFVHGTLHSEFRTINNIDESYIKVINKVTEIEPYL